ncbi:endopeptidase La [bacterium]|nr:MAG: endopeptidase La [bacterium]
MKEHINDYLLDEIPLILPVIPTVDVVVFPQMVVPLLILDEKIIAGIEEAMEGSRKILLLAAHQQPSDYQNPISISDLYKVGTVGNIMRVMQLPEGGIKILTQGLVKAHVEEILSTNDTLEARIQTINPHEVEFDAEQSDIQIKQLLVLVEKIASSGRVFGPDFQVILSQIQDPMRIADFILSHLNLTVQEAQALLEKKTLNQLLSGIYDYLTKEYELNGVKEKIYHQTQESINRSQKEYYLREQMKAIQKELGEESETDLSDLQKKIHELPLTEEARLECIKQFNRLTKTAPESMEATVIRTHLEWVLSMPWGHYTKDNLDIKHAQEVLDNYHYGLDDIKDRILDFLSIKSLKQDCNVPILCFAGPPGVGKTSLGKAIANSLGRNYYRISLGGVYDESEIRGHRRTYVGALPGRFIQAVKKAESMNPLIIIDEIDKIGMSNRGDPSAALLEVLDPEQNKTFYDNYLGVHFDLSQCLFVTTANDLSNVPGPLRDRMEIIQLSGYTNDEKCEIAQKHLVSKAIKNSGLNEKGMVLSKEIIDYIIRHYTQEAGVRDLDRYIQKLCSKYARHLVEKNKKLVFTEDNIQKYLGPSRISPEELVKSHKIGVTNGLAWTPFGGEILQVEAALMPGSGKLLLTGQLGDVMKESAQAALTYAKSHAQDFGIADSMFTSYDLHIHLPAGAIPKDGPSAGISLLSSVLSVLTGRQINGDFAMTGELNLQGKVLPIGGLKEKILAAKQHGLCNVILPKLNQKDLTTLKKVAEGMNIFLVDDVKEVLNHVLLPKLV